MFWILVAVAIAFVLWPSAPKKDESQPSLLARLPTVSAEQPSGGSYMDAVKALQLVRGRLVATDKLDDAARKNLDMIMLYLLAGSEK